MDKSKEESISGSRQYIGSSVPWIHTPGLFFYFWPGGDVREGLKGNEYTFKHLYDPGAKFKFPVHQKWNCFISFFFISPGNWTCFVIDFSISESVWRDNSKAC
jgi:hypothetical protein